MGRLQENSHILFPNAIPNQRKKLRNYVFCASIFFLVVIGLHGFDFLNIVDGCGKKTHGPLTGKRAEKLFLGVPNGDNAIATSRLFALKPHLAGSPQDFQTAKDFLALLHAELGIEPPPNLPMFPAGSTESRRATLSIPSLLEPTAWIDVYYPVLDKPLDPTLEIIGEDGKVAWTATLKEESDDTDPEAGRYSDAIPAWHGLSRGGEVLGRLVHVNYGTKKDYDDLVAKGVNFTGKIAVARYGKVYRGVKVMRAQEVGASGVLVYSDPADDGTVTTENGYKFYPYGPARNPTSVQRGTVDFTAIYPGDPTTPGYPSYENSTRVEGYSRPKIPSLPISWNTAQVLLKEIAQGEKGRQVRFVNNVTDAVTPVWNVMGVIPGHIHDEAVIVGCHRDAWVMGATDPIAGTTALAQVVRAFGALVRKGWKPLRTIIIANWDAEEHGLIGSTEWGEDFTDWIRDHVSVYLNVDTAVSGSRFHVRASPSLAPLMRSIAEELPHPTKANRTLWDATRDSGTLYGKQRKPAEKDNVNDVKISLPGASSDYVVFAQRIGIPSTDVKFSSTLSDPVYHYHSIFDSQRWQEMYADPGFLRCVAVSKHLGLVALRLADSFVIPINTTHYARELESYLDDAREVASQHGMPLDFEELGEAIQSLRAASERMDRKKEKAERKLKKALRKRKWGRWMGGCCEAEDSAESRLLRGFSRGHHGGKKLRRAVRRVRAVNQKLVAFERGFMSEDGIKGREWYRNLAFAPEKYSSYVSTTFPALNEAVTLEGNATLAQEEAGRLTKALRGMAKRLRK